MISLSKKKRILEAFQCQHTGNCCRAEGIVYVSAQEAEGMAQRLNINLMEFYGKYTLKRNGYTVIADRRFRPNCFLDEQKRCRVYTARPKACKTYPDWPSIWESEEDLMQEALLCKGLRIAIEKEKK